MYEIFVGFGLLLVLLLTIFIFKVACKIYTLIEVILGLLYATEEELLRLKRVVEATTKKDTSDIRDHF